jgi:hypothetical protein
MCGSVAVNVEAGLAVPGIVGWTIVTLAAGEPGLQAETTSAVKRDRASRRVNRMVS